jgi:hypothetical protein
MGNREVEMEADVKRYECYIDELQRKVGRVEGVAQALAAALKREKTSYCDSKKEVPRDYTSGRADLLEQKHDQVVLELHLALSYLNNVEELREVVSPSHIVPISNEPVNENEEEKESLAELLAQIDEANSENGKLYLQVRKLQRGLMNESARFDQSIVDHHLQFSYANEPPAKESRFKSIGTVGETDLDLDERDVEWERGVMEYEARIDELVRGNTCVVAYYKSAIKAWRACVAENDELKAIGGSATAAKSVESAPESSLEQDIVDAHLLLSYRNDWHAELNDEILKGRQEVDKLSAGLVRLSLENRSSQKQANELQGVLNGINEENIALQSNLDIAAIKYEQSIVDQHLAMVLMPFLTISVIQRHKHRDASKLFQASST